MQLENHLTTTIIIIALGKSSGSDRQKTEYLPSLKVSPLNIFVNYKGKKKVTLE